MGRISCFDCIAVPCDTLSNIGLDLYSNASMEDALPLGWLVPPQIFFQAAVIFQGVLCLPNAVSMALCTESKDSCFAHGLPGYAFWTSWARVLGTSSPTRSRTMPCEPRQPSFTWCVAFVTWLCSFALKWLVNPNPQSPCKLCFGKGGSWPSAGQCGKVEERLRL